LVHLTPTVDLAVSIASTEAMYWQPQI